MKRTGLTGVSMAAVAALAWHAPAMAGDSIEDRLATMEQRIKYLEERVAAQDQVIVEKERQISALSGPDEDAWFNRVEIGGAIELEAVHESPYEGDSTSDADVGTAELSLAVAVNDSVSSEIVVAKDDDDKIELDTAILTYEPPDSPFSATGGLQVVPFGVYDTNLISDPLTLELGETGKVSLVLGGEADRFHWSVFAFDGDNQPDGRQRVEGYGAAVGFAVEGQDSAFGLDVSWINDIGDSDSLQDAIAENLGEAGVYDGHVSGMSASAGGSLGQASVLLEYVAALDAFEAGEVDFAERGAEPSAWMFELAYGFALGDRDATVAIGYQTSDEALALELPESRVLAGLSVGISENVGLAVEWAQSDDYGIESGGTGETADTVTTVLSAEF